MCECVFVHTKQIHNKRYRCFGFAFILPYAQAHVCIFIALLFFAVYPFHVGLTPLHSLTLVMNSIRCKNGKNDVILFSIENVI